MLKNILQHPLLQKQFPNKSKSYLVDQSFSALTAFFCAHLYHTQDKNIVLISSEKEENDLFLDLEFFVKDHIIELPAWDYVDPKTGLSKEITGQKNSALLALEKEKKIIITTPASLCQKIPVRETLKQNRLDIQIGDRLKPEDLSVLLVDLGYENSPLVYDKGQFASRRYVVDIFDVSMASPIRIEFWGDEIEAIRTFDPGTQKSIEKIEKATLTLADPTKTTNVTLFDHLKDCIVIFEDLLSIEDRILFLKRHPTFHHPLFVPFEKIFEQIKKNQVYYFSTKPLHELGNVTKQKEMTTFEMFSQKIEAQKLPSLFVPLEKGFYSHTELHVDTLAEILQETMQHKTSLLDLFIVSDTKKHQEHIQKSLEHLNAEYLQTTYLDGYLSKGIMAKDQSFGILSTAEIYNIHRLRRQKQREITTPTTAVYMPLPGDLVVHFTAGIGKYIGTEKKKDHTGNQNEFLVLEFAKNSKLFVPMSQAHLITPYVGAKEEKPKLMELGSKKWEKTKQLVESQIIGYARELLEHYAKRKAEKGFSYNQDSEEFQQFEQTFPYVETKDQLQAILDVKSDMMQSKCMDRLVCGDVGYGKTEVALRSAVKAVLDGPMQVAILVPTTVLAMQHFENFKERVKDFPINICQLTRLGGTKQNKQTLQDLENGKMDIVIGTHRLLSKDVKFKNLGLLIIDEEQRFGVRAKEKIKIAKTDIDTLTLSATPIPRTLYMAINKAKDLSMIQTPPQDRLPIRTVLCERNEEVIQMAIERELGRGGQVFFIHNRVESIYKQKEIIQNLIPDANILIGHGQMDAEELDEIFHQFKTNEANILIATSIVENGIDIPNANTIIIDRADRFGIADLYQLRGRVGRWNKEAYAYFLTPEKTVLREDARKRLLAVVEAASFGGGYQIAMRDLEIRGAGNILGTQQSGQVSSIGFHLYCRLLQKTMNRLQGQKTAFVETKIEFPYPARLGSSYIPSEELRLEMYRRLGEAEKPEDVDVIFDELKDRFGKAPSEATWLYHMMRLRAKANQLNYSAVKIKENRVTLTTARGKGIDHFITLPQDPKQVEEKILQIFSS